MLGITLLLSCCGSVGDPLPPHTRIPNPITDLSAHQIGNEIVISWSWPLRTTGDAFATRLQGFTLWTVKVEDFTKDLEPVTIHDHRKQIHTIETSDLKSKPGQKQEVRLPLIDLEIGQPLILVATAWDEKGRDAGYSNQVRLQPVEAPEQPDWSHPLVQPTGVALTWDSALRADTYQLERSSEEDPRFKVLGRIEGTVYLDRSLEWGITYNYRIRPYRKSDSGWVEGPVSANKTVTLLDRFAPISPKGLRAVRTESSVELSWLANAEEDLIGYRVWRDLMSITEMITDTFYSDTSVRQDESYEYSLQAIDSNGNESLKSPQLQVPSVVP